MAQEGVDLGQRDPRFGREIYGNIRVLFFPGTRVIREIRLLDR